MNALIVYFSFSGRTERLSSMIAQWLQKKAVSVELFRLPYNPDNSFFKNCLETVQKKNIFLEDLPDLSEKRLLFLGCPVWVFDIPAAMRTYLEESDFSGKELILFTTYGSGKGKERAMAIFKEMVETRGGTVIGTFDVRGRIVADEKDRVNAILNSLFKEKV